jgi:DNA-binding transcriptional regulator LsrR (DeoR family)
MATKKDIFFTIDENGEVKIEVKGAPGEDCMKLTKEIEEALGLVGERTMTSEYFQKEDQTIEVGSGSGNG